MARRRMFSVDVVETDTFLELSKDSRLLYFSLGMSADDDGVVSGVKIVLLVNDLPEEALEELVNRGYLGILIPGVYVILHWNQSNHIQNDRKKDSVFKRLLDEKYEIVDNVYIPRIQCGSILYPQDRKASRVECNSGQYKKEEGVGECEGGDDLSKTSFPLSAEEFDERRADYTAKLLEYK